MKLCAVLLPMSLGACASTPGASPDDMSAAGHEAVAAAEEASAARDEAQIGWTSKRNPSSDERAEIERLRRMAAEHRAASKALRDAEARACSNLSEDDRGVSPFERYSDIVSVAPINAGGRFPRVLGATVHFRAVPGLTKEWLERLVDCHVARIAALGHEVPEMPTCPLVPNDTSASVSSSDSGFDVDVKSWDEATAREVLRRARALVDRR